MISFEFTVDDKSTVKMLEEQKARLTPRRIQIFLRQAGVRMKRSIRQNFKEQGRPVKWPPLSPKTIENRMRKKKAARAERRRAKKSLSNFLDSIGAGDEPRKPRKPREGRKKEGKKRGPGAGLKIMIDTGRLWNSIIPEMSISGNAVEIGTNVRNKKGGSFVPHLHYGLPEKNLPARNVIMFQLADITWLEQKALKIFGVGS